jgi:hypothetical protein
VARGRFVMQAADVSCIEWAGHQTLDAGEQIASPRAFVATVTTRLAINELRCGPRACATSWAVL